MSEVVMTKIKCLCVTKSCGCKFYFSPKNILTKLARCKSHNPKNNSPSLAFAAMPRPRFRELEIIYGKSKKKKILLLDLKWPS